MDDDPTHDDTTSSKRSDVGYKQPPVEHQFKAGQKPPARKRRPGPQTVARTLMMILEEEVPLNHGGKVRWMRNGALLVEVAFQLAEQGNPTLSRALIDYLIAGEPAPSQDVKMIVFDRPTPRA